MTPTGATHQPLRILLAINGTDFGGTESALAEIARHLDRRGHEVHVLSLKTPGRTGQRLIDDGLTVHTFGMAEVVDVRNMLVAVRHFVGWLRRHPVDVVQSFLPRANVISRVANHLAPGRRGHLSSERSTDFNRSPRVCQLNRWTARWTDRVLAVSPLVRDVLLERDRLPVEKIHLLENGIDTERVDAFPKTALRRELGLAEGDLLFATVGRLIPDKGYVYLAQALARLDPERRVHLALVGEGDEGAKIRAEVERLGLEDRFHFVGYRKDVLGIMKDIDAFVLTSLEEGIPVVLVEAMANHLPIVSTRVGGIPDLVVENETALLVPPAELWHGSSEERTSEATREAGVAALATALDRLAANPDLRHRLGHAGRHRIETVFHLERIIERLEQHYHQVLAAIRR